MKKNKSLDLDGMLKKIEEEAIERDSCMGKKIVALSNKIMAVLAESKSSAVVDTAALELAKARIAMHAVVQSMMIKDDE